MLNDGKLSKIEGFETDFIWFYSLKSCLDIDWIFVNTLKQTAYIVH